jgi:hypothetical protein
MMADFFHYEDSPGPGRVVDEPVKAKQPICLMCKYLLGFTPDAKPYCKAFPNGIPDKFWDAKVDHTVPYTGDNGITFEP